MNDFDKEKAREFLELADARLKECRKLQLNSLPNRMVCRFAYLSLLYAALAILEKVNQAGDFDIDAHAVEHERMIMTFQKRFVIDGTLSKDFSDALYATMDIWMDNDRNPKTVVTGEDTERFVNLSEELIEEARERIIPAGKDSDA